MATCFHSQWLVAATVSIRKPRTVAVLASGRRNSFRTMMKPERFLKLSMEKSKCYSPLAGKDRRIYCNGDEGEGPPMEDLTEAEELVEKFYRSINDRNVSQLSALLTEDCIYEDALFYSPFKGKKNISRFAANLMEAMGPNIKFDAQVFPDGSAAEWMLMWKSQHVPYMTGFNWFEHRSDQGMLLISKIGGVDQEARVKPGVRILKVLKIISTTLDASPSVKEAISYSLPKIYRNMRANRSLRDIAELLEEIFKSKNDGNDPRKSS